jgi:hypothetical protein
MDLTRTSLLRLIKILTTLVVICVIVGYAIWRSLNYARGPHLDITEPVDGSAITAATTTVRGIAERINNLTLNGNPILMDEKGHFNEVIIVFTGTNRLTVEGQDQFGRSTRTLIEIVGKNIRPTTSVTLSPTPIISTSTATTTKIQ